jgi:inhibitor of cysteine peptidase
MKKAYLIFLAVLLVLVPLNITGCSSGTGNTTPQVDISYDELLKQKHFTKQLEISKDEPLVVSLGASPTTGFSWGKNAAISDPAIIQQTEQKTIAPTAKVAGASTRDIWTFKALKAGTAKITFDYSQPWNGGAKGEWTVELNVTVK